MTPVAQRRDGHEHEGAQQRGDDDGDDDAHVVQQVVHPSLDTANILIFMMDIRNLINVISYLQLMDDFKTKYLKQYAHI